MNSSAGCIPQGRLRERLWREVRIMLCAMKHQAAQADASSLARSRQSQEQDSGDKSTLTSSAKPHYQITQRSDCVLKDFVPSLT
jgi:tetraacyldisaccharide-1-P 4'-kinase